MHRHVAHAEGFMPVLSRADRAGVLSFPWEIWLMSHQSKNPGFCLVPTPDVRRMFGFLRLQNGPLVQS
jgi:hypothetical protein